MLQSIERNIISVAVTECKVDDQSVTDKAGMVRPCKVSQPASRLV